MAQSSPYDSPTEQNLFKYLLEDALQILEKRMISPDSKDFKKVIHLLKRCEVFRNLFPAQAMLNDFLQLAKYYVCYETHEYGTVLLREKEYADKFCLILKGSVEKFRQKAYREIEHEVHEDRRLKSLAVVGSSLPYFSIPSLTGKNWKSHRPSKFIDLSVQQPTSANECIETKQEVEEEERPEAEEDDFKGTRKRCATNDVNVNSSPLLPNFSQTLEKISRKTSYRKETILLKGGAGDETPLVGSHVDQDEEELIRYVCEKNPDVKQTYFMGDVLRATKIKTYETGESFGESFCRPNFPKSNSMLAVSSEKVHLLTLGRDDYNYIMAELERRVNEKLEVFWSLFPLADKKSIREFSQHFSQRSYHVDEIIYSQDDVSQDTYLLLSGEVQLCKESELPEEDLSPSRTMVSLPSNPRIGDIAMTTVIKNQFFGEEILLEKDYRQSTAIAKSPNTVTYYLEACAFDKIKEQFANFFEVLKKNAQEKFTWRQQKISERTGNSHSPLRKVERHRSLKTLIISPRGSIVIGDRQSPQKRSSIFVASPRPRPTSIFITSTGQLPSDKSPGSSPYSSVTSFDEKKPHSIGEEDNQPHTQRVEVYKSQFARRVHTLVKSSNNSEEDGGKVSQRAKENKKEKAAAIKKANIRKSMDFTPQFILEEFNLRRDLYEDKKKVSHLVSPRGLAAPGQKPHKKFMNTPTILPSLYDSPRGVKVNNPKEVGTGTGVGVGASGFHHRPKQNSITGLQNFMPTHMIFERFTKQKKNSLEGNHFSATNSYANSYENSPRHANAFENIHVNKKVANKLRFK